ncbi:MAG TPA: amino acid adenylation domain-containing protein, partial [Longimicrobiaceae bacterium]|nr:amino acid adenylation domain-containing protein [Longimicrobiaceae bacterium]
GAGRAARSVHGAFAAQAARTPDAPAVAAGGRTLTYAELERASNRLARYLRGRGVGPETPVGVCMERSPELAAALLGVLKAGALYLPLDPAYPAERLAWMLADSGAPLLLTDAASADRVPASGPARVVLDAELSAAAGESADPPAPPAVEPDAAYVIYTSGSTGTPKGVVVPHRALVEFLDSMRARPGLHAGDTLLAVTTLSFDIAGLELFGPLTSGARVVLADRDTASDGALLADALAASGATVMQATPATWRMLLDAGWAGAPRLRALCGGEALPRELADRLLPRVGELWNLYGPTETTVWSTVQRVEPGEGPVPIGLPIARTTAHVLDAWGGQAAPGVPGELWIGGEGVARGYHGRPELTAERFVPDPFSADPGARLYRTGDRVRVRADGALEFLGRLDAQVKLRGHRVEPGEVEAALARHPGVREAAVVARDDAPGEKRLVAYLVPAEGAELPAGELRAWLGERLPAYMVPSAWVVMERFPLTPSGKTDRRALPAPDAAAPAVYAPPRDATEALLCSVWAEVLGVERVGVHDDFFDLGGHSLLATRVVSRAAAVLDASLPVRAVLDA